MGFLDTKQGHSVFDQYLKKFDGKASQKVYRSEIRQFFEFFDGDLQALSESVFHKYRDHIGQGANGKTLKRKFSILNQFFKFLEENQKDFKSPIGRSYGDMQSFQSGVYAESESFSGNLGHWMENLVCESTKKTYSGHVLRFFKWVNKEPKDLSQEDFIDYRNHLLKEKRMKISTVWNKFIAISGYMRFLAGKSRKFKNPMDFNKLSLAAPKKDKGYYTVLTEKEVRELLKMPDRRYQMAKRDYALLRLMLTYGLRAGEVCKLRFQDIEGERVNGQQKIWIRDRKGRIGRRTDTDIILNGKALEAFDEWMEASGIRFEADTPIFPSFIWDAHAGGLVVNHRRLKAKKPLSVKTIENVVFKYVKKAGITRGNQVVSPHALRHTALTMLAKAGVELIDLKYLAGHQNVSTTMIYLHSVQSYEDHAGMHHPINR